jgi:RecB family exonuclease
LRISDARLETYLDCPQRYKFLYLDRMHEGPRVELEFSRTVHKALRFLHDPRDASVPTLDEVVKRWGQEWDRLPEIEGLSEHRSLGLTMLRNYYSAHVPLKEDVLAVDQAFELPLDDHVLKGILDRVGRDASGNIVVTDYKTSGTLPTQPDIDRSKQAAIYHHSAQKLYPGHPVVVRLHFLRFDFIFETVPLEDAWIESKGEMLRAIYGIESAHFPPKPGSVCEYCDFTLTCPAMRHLFEPRKDGDLSEEVGIDEAAREYIELEETIKSSTIKVEELSQRIMSFMAEEGLTRLFVDDFVLFKVKGERQEWDEERLAEVLARLNLLEDALGIKIDRVLRLLKSVTLPPEQKKEIETCRELQSVDELKCASVDEDRD